MLAVVGVLALVPTLVRPYPQLDLPGGAGPARAVAYERNGNLLVGRPDGVVRRFAANGSDLRPIDSLRPPLT
jgi:hypothetical protein